MKEKASDEDADHSENIYKRDERRELAEDGQISLNEEAFMDSYDDAEFGHMEEE